MTAKSQYCPQKTAPFACKADADTLIKEKTPLPFLKKCNFAKNRKKAPFASMVSWMPEIEKVPCFDLELTWF